jgi:DNA-binding NarL/FixJ family response regulator
MDFILSRDRGRLPARDFDPPIGHRPAARVLLVDDHPVVRQGIKQILTDAFESIEVGEASDAGSALSAIRTSVWSVVVLDISMPDISGLDVLRDLRREQPDLPILILSMHPAEQFARRAIDSGASAYLTKHSDPRELVRVVQTLVDHGAYPDSQAEAGLPGVQPPTAARQPHEELSDREYQVLRMIALGKTVSQIASEIQLSVKTVSTYRARVLEKMNMRTTAELMRYAIVNHLVD